MCVCVCVCVLIHLFKIYLQQQLSAGVLQPLAISLRSPVPSSA